MILSLRSCATHKLVRGPAVRLCGRRYTSTSIGESAQAQEPFRIFFCGSDDFSVASLKAVVEAKDVWQSIEVLTPRVREVGRGNKGAKRAEYVPALQRYAESSGLSVNQVPPEGIKHYKLPETFQTPSPTNLLLTGSFGHILPNSFLSHFSPTHRLNVHPSLLPRCRGAAPVQWTIANGDTETGVSVQRLVEKGKGIDGGELVGIRDGIAVRNDVRFEDLLCELAVIGGEVLVDVLRRMRHGTIDAFPQDTARITRAPKIAHETARAQWSSQDATTIERMHRAISHQYPIWTTLAGVQIQLLDISLATSNIDNATQPGTAVLDRRSKPPELIVTCAGGSHIKVSRVKAEGKKEVNVGDWWNGLPREVRKGKEITLQ